MELNLKPSRKILLLNWRDKKNPFAGGAEVFAYEIAKRFVRDGFEVTWFTSTHFNLPKTEVYDGIEVFRKGSWISVYFFAFFYACFKFRKSTDIIIDCQNGIPFFTPLYSRKKIITVIHHVHQEIFKYHAPSIWIKYLGIFLEKLTPLVYKNKTVVTVSDSTKESMQKLGFKKNIHIIPNGINECDCIAPSEKTASPSLLYLGRLKAYKNIDHIIQAVKLLKRDFPDIKLLIAGTGEEKNTLETLVNKYSLEENIRFLGFVDEKQKHALLASSWMLIYPSDHEGWGISVIEANRHQTPAVGSNVHGLKDAIKHNATGLLFERGNIDQLASSIKELFLNTKKRELLSQNALKWSEEFSWEKSYNLFKTLI